MTHTTDERVMIPGGFLHAKGDRGTPNEEFRGLRSRARNSGNCTQPPAQTSMKALW